MVTFITLIPSKCAHFARLPMNKHSHYFNCHHHAVFSLPYKILMILSHMEVCLRGNSPLSLSLYKKENNWSVVRVLNSDSSPYPHPPTPVPSPPTSQSHHHQRVLPLPIIAYISHPGSSSSSPPLACHHSHCPQQLFTTHLSLLEKPML